MVVTRPFSTGDSKDYTFAYSLTTLNLIWAVGPSTNFNSEHSTKGTTSVTFTPVLGVDDVTFEDGIKIYPNPSSGLFNIDNSTLSTVETVKIFNPEAQLIKQITTATSDANIPVDLSGLAPGTYFMEISNPDDRTVKKIIIN